MIILLLIRAAMFTRVIGTVSCFCNKRLLNCPTVYTNFTTWPASWFVNSIFYWTSRSGSSISLFLFSDSVVFDKVSTAIRVMADMLNWQYLTIGGIFLKILCVSGPQRAIKMSWILSHLVTAWSNYILAFLTFIWRHVLIFGEDACMALNFFFVYFLSACVSMRTWWLAVMSCACQLIK